MVPSAHRDRSRGANRGGPSPPGKGICLPRTREYILYAHAPWVSSRQAIRTIEADGWLLVRVAGDHHQFRHPTKPGKVTVPHP
jgi:HicA toxin of bacterial toxin-antitoxin,